MTPRPGHTPDYDPHAAERCDCGHLHVQHGLWFAHGSARPGCWWCGCTHDHITDAS